MTKIQFLYVPILTSMLASAGWAQTPDVISRPTGVATLTAQTSDIGSIPTSVCWYVDGTDPLDVASHVQCEPTNALAQIIEATIPAPLGAGTKVYRAVAINSSGISEPSPNTDTVPDLPVPPTLLE